MFNFILKIPIVNKQLMLIYFFNNCNICFLGLYDLLNKTVIVKLWKFEVIFLPMNFFKQTFFDNSIALI